jgi:predicted transcriptional regulator
MSPKKRFKDQIIAEILKACEGEGTSKTKVVYASGLNFLTIKPYLVTLDKVTKHIEFGKQTTIGSLEKTSAPV